MGAVSNGSGELVGSATVYGVGVFVIVKKLRLNILCMPLFVLTCRLYPILL